jgi:DNA repair exonuclease SbcCD ATPase subunit
MRIKRLKLKNWGPHEALDLDMNAPVFGLLGPNMAGKSNILNAIAFAFTGMLDENQQTYVRRIAGEEGPTNGSVELTFVKGGVEGRIMRQVGTSPRRQLWWDGSKTAITKHSEMEARLQEILACDKDAVRQAVFLSQGKIGGLLFGTNAQREEEFARMSLIDHLYDVAEIAGQEISRVQKLVTDLTSQRDEALNALEETMTSLQRAQDDLRLTPDHAAALKWVADVLAAISESNTRASALQNARQLLAEAQETLKALQSPEDKPEDKKAELLEILKDQESLGALQQTLTRGAALRKNAEAHLQNLKSQQLEFASQVGQREPLVLALAEIERKVRGLEESRTLYEKEDAWKRQAEPLQLRVEEAKKLVENSSALNSPEAYERLENRADEAKQAIHRLKFGLDHRHEVGGQCPLCGGTDFSKLPSEDNARAQLAARETELEELRRAYAEMRRADTQRQQAEQALTSLQEQWARLEPLRPQGTPEHTREAVALLPDALAERLRLTRQLDVIDRALEQLKRLHAEIAQANETLLLHRELSEIEAEIRATQAKLETLAAAGTPEQLRARVTAIDTFFRAREIRQQRVATCLEMESAARQSLASAEEAEKHQRQMRPGTIRLDQDASAADFEKAEIELKENQARRLRAEGYVDACTQALRRAESRLEDIRARESKQQAIHNLLGELDELRRIFSRSGIPRTYLTKLFAAIVTQTQRNLEIWDAGFQVEADDEKMFNFLFYRSSEPEVLLDQSKMSGGQRVRMALSFVQSVQQIVFPGLDFMCVDEPSTHLDQEGVEGLVRLFQNMGSQNAAGESQVIVVDHNPLLQTAFHKSHTLKAPK